MSIVVLYNIVSFVVCRQVSLSTRMTAHHGRRLATFLSLGAFLFTIPLISNAQGIDTIKRLEEVTVSGQRTPTTLRTAAPTQVLDAEQMEKLGAMQLSDAVKQMAGITLKDYGGVGGIKTVSARGLGSQFSAVTLDGVPVDDSQNGQVDLSRYLLGNAAYVSFSQGQEQSSLLSARAYAAGNTLNMETSEPQFWPGEHTKVKVGSEVGSFGFLSPTLHWEQRWSKKLKSSFWANYLYSRGDYPFSLYNSATGRDDSHRDYRKHSAVWMATADGNLFYTHSKGNTLVTKVHYMRDAHELPGRVVLYSQVTPEEYSTEELAFVQTRWRVEREAWKGQLLGKLRYSYDDYTDSTAGNDIYDRYRQGEAFVSGSLSRRLTPWLDIDLAADGDLSHLRSTLTQRNRVTRTSLSAVAALRFHTQHFELRANALYTDIADRVGDSDNTPAYRRVTPFVSMMYKVGKGTTLRAFYKQTYRAPNFGELYFFMLLPELRPEQANQVNLGFTQSFGNEEGTFSGQLTVDGYYNHVKDKIVAKPSVNIYYWSMENLGIVDILGLDATLNFQLSAVNLQLHYTFQSAQDHTDPSGETLDGKAYGYQIVYTPRHSGGGSVRWENRWVNLGASAMVVGHRYSERQNAADNRLPAYCDIALTADRSFDLRFGTLSIRATLQNLLDAQYEIVAAYPMPGRNWRLGLFYEF